MRWQVAPPCRSASRGQGSPSPGWKKLRKIVVPKLSSAPKPFSGFSKAAFLKTPFSINWFGFLSMSLMIPSTRSSRLRAPRFQPLFFYNTHQAQRVTQRACWFPMKISCTIFEILPPFSSSQKVPRPFLGSLISTIWGWSDPF